MRKKHLLLLTGGVILWYVGEWKDIGFVGAVGLVLTVWGIFGDILADVTIIKKEATSVTAKNCYVYVDESNKVKFHDADKKGQ